MEHLPERIGSFPNICGSEAELEKTIRESLDRPVFLNESPIRFNEIESACTIALHMHQPLIPAGGGLPFVRRGDQ